MSEGDGGVEAGKRLHDLDQRILGGILGILAAAEHLIAQVEGVVLEQGEEIR